MFKIAQAGLIFLMVSAAPAAADGLLLPPRVPAAESRSPQTVPRPDPKMPGRMRIAVLGAVGGLIAGGFTGALIEQRHGCKCADTPIRGFMIGGLAGAVPGAVIGFRLAP